MVLPSKKSDFAMVLSSKMAYSGDNTMILSDFFDDCTMVLLKLKNISRKTTPWRKNQVIDFCPMLLLLNFDVLS